MDEPPHQTVDPNNPEEVWCGGVPQTTVDVREMLCAQALAQVARAMDHLAPGQALAVRYNADDVRRDLLAWAADRGHLATEAHASILQLRKAS